MSATALYKALIEANVSEVTAERAVEGLAVARDVATKTDLAGLKIELKTDITELKTDIAELKVGITELEVRLIKWNVAAAGLIIAAMGLMIKFL